jgi:hypothetical protein
LLFKYFLNTGGGAEVKPFEVAVQTLGGSTIELTMDNAIRRTVGDLKDAIEQREGTSQRLQELFLLGDKNGEEEGGGEGSVGDVPQQAMESADVIERPCTLVLCVKLEEVVLGWNTTSPLIGHGIFEISGHNNSIATKVLEDEGYDNCLFADGLAMEECTGKHRLSIKVLPDDEYRARTYGNRSCEVCIGVARDGIGWDQDPFLPDGTRSDNELGFGMFLGDGSLFGNGKYGTSYIDDGEIFEDQVVTMELDTDAHTLKFWVDGKPHGPGFRSGVVGSLRWALSMGPESHATQIVPSADVEFEEC